MTSSAKKTLAIIADDSDLRDGLAKSFLDAFTIHTSLGDPGTIRMLLESRPDAIVLDLDLGTFDGLELLRLIEARPELRAKPLVALTANGESSRVEQAHQLGAADVATKPLRSQDLRATVEALLNGSCRRNAGRLKLGDLLVASGLITHEQLAEALARQRAGGGRLGEVLVSEHLVTEGDIVNAVAGQTHIGVVDLTQLAPEPLAIGLLPRDFIIRHRLVPMSIDEQGSLVLAMTNPLDVIVIDEVSMRTKKRVVPVICTESGFDEAVAIYFSSRGKLKGGAENVPDEVEPQDAEDLDATTMETVDTLLADAVQMGASDIHLEPRADTLFVRCRIDGVLHELREYPKELQAGILSRLKIMGNMNIAERRLPQDGRTTFELSGGQVVDVRLASIPSMYGENLTLRILEVSALPPTLASLGLQGDQLERFERALLAPEGGIAICGPTGSGKSTTLYTTLELIKSPERKVYTVEDPIERKIPDIVQTEVKPRIGLTFAHVLRSLVRADPDVIMVGEIRDLETAKMAADAAITGHQVFTTLHTNDAASAVNRLVEMGVPRYLVAAAWRCFVAQRLVRRLCKDCKRPARLTATRWEELGLGVAPGKRMDIFEPVGCPKCFGTGYRGRLGLYEVLTVDDDMRELIATGGTLMEIQRGARAEGVGSLRDDGVRKVLDGSTSYLELLRVTI